MSQQTACKCFIIFNSIVSVKNGKISTCFGQIFIMHMSLKMGLRQYGRNYKVCAITQDKQQHDMAVFHSRKAD